MSQATTPEDGEESEDGRSPSRDDLFEVLSNRRRRYALRYLKREADGTAELSDVADQVAAWEQGVPKEDLSYDQRRSARVSLYQHHAAKMDEAGVVDYDDSERELRLTDEAVDMYIETVPESDQPWAVYFTAIWGVTAYVVVAGVLNLPPLAVSDAACAVFAVVVFGASSLAFLYDTRYRMRVDGDGSLSDAGE